MNAPEPMMPGRRRIDPAEPRRFYATMRNDFLTPRGTPYKWQEVTAEVSRTVIGSSTRTVVPVGYEWERVSSRTGTPTDSTDSREWTFARGQSFKSVLLHTDVVGASPSTGVAAPATMDISYPKLPKAPAVDLLLMLSWDVITFDMMATHLIATRALRQMGGTAELHGISGTWAELKFSDPGAVAVFHNAVFTARHLGYGQVGGRPSAIYSSQCVDCKLDFKSGPVRQRGRSSYWVIVQVDVETGDLLHAEMTEMIVATLSGADGKPVPVQKRRLVQMSISGLETEHAVEPSTYVHDQLDLVEAVGGAERVADYVRWQISSLEKLPAGAAELAVMGFRSTVGADSDGVYRQVKALRSGLQAMVAGDDGAGSRVRVALSEHRRHLEGLLAFGQIAVDEATRLGVQDEPRRKALAGYIGSVRTGLVKLLKLIDRLEGRQ